MPSLELPMTDTTRAILRREYQEMRWARLLLRAAVLVGIPLFVAYELTPRMFSPEVKAAAGTVVLGALGVGALVALWLTWAHARDERHIRRDLRSPHYLRTTGHLTVRYVDNDEGGGWFLLYLDEQRMRSPWGRAEPPFTNVKDAAVDHTPHAHVIFAVTDPEGWRIYVAAGYKVPPARHSGRTP
jgi:Co/Zn/Cd efflux system component